jgi:hypothetical protein
MNLNGVRSREDWWFGVIIRGKQSSQIELHRHADYASIEFEISPPPLSESELHETAVREIERWEKWERDQDQGTLL